MGNDIFFSSETFGDFLRRLRLEHGYSQDTMATKMGLSQNSYCLMENGRTRITLEHIQDISNVLEVSSLRIIASYALYIADSRKSSL
ncbi:helix-turn-helix domain-containing protein [Sphingobacterium paucimobilis]|uniref:HTH cro/C1-type domain-containing protein n=1 Tax=Sphingobacterium paucimobilis HER1398 TaxID=1346330 RepID=U2JBV4_9SPHI|nr:helix-turn-helix transcriptional regulator [Sphingobacterium paucimobilis]ERJ60128.1 hypothetical protein M472_15290 [Sphingobacterium paucimobilis HER1398]